VGGASFASGLWSATYCAITAASVNTSPSSSCSAGGPWDCHEVGARLGLLGGEVDLLEVERHPGLAQRDVRHSEQAPGEKYSFMTAPNLVESGVGLARKDLAAIEKPCLCKRGSRHHRAPPCAHGRHDCAMATGRRAMEARRPALPVFQGGDGRAR
jgi:hypothetical protein